MDRSAQKVETHIAFSSLNAESCNRISLCGTFTFENVRSPKKKTVVFQKKFKTNKKKRFIMQLVSKDAIMFTPKTWKKCTQKLLIIGPHFLRTGLAAQTAHKQKSHTTKCPLMQNWVFRLRCFLYLVQIFGCSFPSPQSLKHLSKNDIAALCEKMNDSATFLDKQTITIHIHHRGLRCIQYTFFWS